MGKEKLPQVSRMVVVMTETNIYEAPIIYQLLHFDYFI